MAESLSVGWRELKRPSQAECPKLFYNLVFVGNELNLQLTDLVAIWSCSLNKQEIIESAKAQHASIDPSQSNSQLQVLLQKLDQGLKSDDNVLYHDKDIESQSIHLKTYVKLPKPLKPLTWIFKLAPQPATELAEHLLRPCLFEASISKRKLESLRNVIKEKDHILSRLFERIEATSTDLSMIFPGITGLKSRRGRVTVREAERHVPGMRKFDAEEWVTHFNTDNPYAGYDQKGINNLVIGCEKCPTHAAKEHFSWLERLPEYGSKPTIKSRSLGKIGALSARPILTNDDESTASEDEFERQPTPPSLQDKGYAKASQQRSGSSPAVSDVGRDRIRRKGSDNAVCPERPTDPSKRHSSSGVGRSSTASQRHKHDRSVSSASTASETESEVEASIEPRKDGLQVKEPTLSPLTVPENAGDNLKQNSAPSSSDDDDLDLDSQADKKPAHESDMKTSTSSQKLPKSQTTPPQAPSTPSRRLLNTTKSTTPQTTPPQPRHPTNPPSDPSTPSKTRRLGRLGTSQSQSHSLSPQTQQSRFFNPQLNSNTGSSNANTKLTFSPTNDQAEDEDENITSFLSTTTDPDAETEKKEKESTPEPEKKVETASEAANRRRRELKRKLQPVKQDRKKRKF